MKLTDAQKKEIYCVKHGHSKIKTACFGYIYCARCESQVGDTLGSVYDADDDVIVGHVGKDMEGCNCTKNYEALPVKEKKHIAPKIIRLLDKELRKSKRTKEAA